jgi:hypothetical protein
MSDSKFEGTDQEWDALVKKNREENATNATTFLERLILEEEELGKKIIGLNNGLYSDGFAEKVGEYQFNLLSLQHSAMISYRQILTMRIKDLKSK